MRERYDSQARRYREDDERHANDPDHVRVCGKLRALCNRLSCRVDVLDLGCGTGRYFHCLRNVRSLTGVDVSPAMLEQAQNPLCWPEGAIDSTKFICGDFYVAEFGRNNYNLIYSLGVFGNGCALSVELARKLQTALRPGGCFLFDTIDISFLPFARQIRLRLRNRLHRLLPTWIQAAWDARTGWLPPFLPKQGELLKILKESGFSDVEVVSEPATLPSGPGRKFECIAWKPREDPSLSHSGTRAVTGSR